MSIINPIGYNFTAADRANKAKEKAEEKLRKTNNPYNRMLREQSALEQEAEGPKFLANEQAILENQMFARYGGLVPKYLTGGNTNQDFIRKFADGGMTEGNLEGNELLINPSSFGLGGVPQTLTDYQNLPPHPEDGSMDPNGTVPLPKGTFVVPKHLSKKYREATETGDKILASAIMNNTQVLKAKKEQADYMAMEKSYNKFMSKYGGLIEKMKYGGNVKKYADGDYVRRDTPPQPPFFERLNEPEYYGVQSASRYSSDPNRDAPKDFEGVPYRLDYKTPKNKNNSADSFKTGNLLPYATTLGLGLEALLQKPFKLDPKKYQIKSKLQPYQMKPDYEPFIQAEARGSYGLRRMGNVGNYMANMANLSTSIAGQKGEYFRKLQEANAQSQMAADEVNIRTEGTNLQTSLSLAQFNEQNEAARRNALREQFGQNLPAVHYNNQQNQLTAQALMARYPEFKFNFG